MSKVASVFLLGGLFKLKKRIIIVGMGEQKQFVLPKINGTSGNGGSLMEQVWTFITENTLYVAAGYAILLLALTVYSIHRINRSIRLQKKQMKKIQDMLSAIEPGQDRVLTEEEAMPASTVDQEEQGQAVPAEGWTREQEHLVNEVLGEVFS